MAKILIVDDASLMRAILKDIIVNRGFEIIGEAKDGAEAVEMFRMYSPDLVFLDITMPGLNGIEALRQMIEINSRAKIIICSALGQKKLVAEAIQIGASDFIVKPFKAERIIEAIQKVFNQARL